jgi:hypothetical protein
VVPTLRCRHSAGRPPPPRRAWAPAAERTAGHCTAAEGSGGGCREADQGTPCAAAQGAQPRPRRTRGAAPGGVEIDLTGGGAVEGSGRLRGSKKTLSSDYHVRGME